MTDLIQTPSFSDDLRRYISLILHWFWLIILAVLLAGIAAFVISQQMTPLYEASATMLINQAPSSSDSNEYAALLTSQRLAETYAQMLTTQPIMDGAIQSLGLSVNAENLKERLSVTPIRDTQLIKVSVRHTNQLLAAKIANEIVITFSEYIKNFQCHLTRLRQIKVNSRSWIEGIGVVLSQFIVYWNIKAVIYSKSANKVFIDIG